MRYPDYIKILLAVVFAITASGCVKSSLLYDETQGEISISPVSSVVSRSVLGPLSGTYPSDETMGIIAYSSEMTGSWTGSLDGASLYIDGGEFKYNDFYKQWAGWDGTKHYPYYWPEEGSLIFAGYSPYRKKDGNPVSDASFDVMNKTLSINGYQVEAYVPMTDEQMYDGSTQYENKCQSDLMYFLPAYDASGNYVGTSVADAYSVMFNHALAQVVFNVKAENQYDLDYMRLKKIVLNDIMPMGDFTARMGDGMAGTVNWTLSQGVSLENMTVLNYSNAAGMRLGTSYRQVAQILTIPSGLHDIDIAYTLNVNGSYHEETMTFQDSWEPGKKYVYNIILGTDFIKLVPDVKEWVEINE